MDNKYEYSSGNNTQWIDEKYVHSQIAHLASLEPGTSRDAPYGVSPESSGSSPRSKL